MACSKPRGTFFFCLRETMLIWQNLMQRGVGAKKKCCAKKKWAPRGGRVFFLIFYKKRKKKMVSQFLVYKNLTKWRFFKWSEHFYREFTFPIPCTIQHPKNIIFWKFLNIRVLMSHTGSRIEGFDKGTKSTIYQRICL